MHDIVSHNLTVMIALADGARYALDSSPEQAADAIERVVRHRAPGAGGDARLLGVLRDDSVARSARAAADARAPRRPARPRRCGRDPGHVDLDGDLRRSPRESSWPSSASPRRRSPTRSSTPPARPPRDLELRCRAGQVDLDVTNTGDRRWRRAELVGSGHRTASDGRGLRGMRERAHVYGGDLDVGPTDDGGWRVHLRLHADAPRHRRRHWSVGAE